MPNIIRNKIILPSLRMKDVLKFCDKDGDKYNFNFNKLIPMPKSIMETPFDSIARNALDYYLTYLDPKCPYLGINIDGKNNIEEHARACSRVEVLKRYLDKLDVQYDIVRESEVSNLEEYRGKDVLIKLGEQQVYNLETYHHLNWFDWAIENWGTKWNAMNTHIKDNYITFDTAWSVPMPILIALSKELNCKIAVLSACEFMGQDTSYCLMNKGKIDYKGEFKDDSIDAWKLAMDIWDAEDEYMYDAKEKRYVYKERIFKGKIKA